MNRKKRIVFVLPDLVAGGAERVMSFVAKNISEDHFETSLWLAGFESNNSYDVGSIKVKYFNKTRVLKAIPNFFFELLRNKPDIVISSISHLNTAMGILSVFFPRTKFIGREANVLSVLKNYTNKKKFYSSLLFKLSYGFLDIILCQSKDMENDMIANFNIPEHKIRLINNPITDDFDLKPTNYRDTLKGIHFITVARLKKQKGHERIIRALSKLNVEFTYTIIGDGPEKSNVLNLIKEMGLEKNIVHIPFTKEVNRYLTKSDFFLQGAYVEGFPNCLIESCSIGTPVIAFKAPGGLDEIIEEGVNGFISLNEDEFIENIMKAIHDVKWVPALVRESVFKKFNKEKIIGEYEKLFLEV